MALLLAPYFVVLLCFLNFAPYSLREIIHPRYISCIIPLIGYFWALGFVTAWDGFSYRPRKKSNSIIIDA